MTTMIQNTDPMLAVAKGKGCSATMRFGAPPREERIFLGGMGVASLSTGSRFRPSTLAELDTKGIASMEWVSNRMFGQHSTLGEVRATFKTKQTKSQRSTAVVVPATSTNILPALIVNTIYLDIAIPALGVKLSNQTPFILTSNSAPPSPELIRADVRVQRDVAGLPRMEQAILNGQRVGSFLAFGVHKQAEAVELFSRGSEAPDAVLTDASVMTLPHYGLEVELASSKVNRLNWSAEMTVVNLLNRDLSLQWFCDPHNRVKVVKRTGKVRLRAKESARVRISGTIGAEGSQLDAQDAVLFGVCNVATGHEDFVSGYLALGFV